MAVEGESKIGVVVGIAAARVGFGVPPGVGCEVGFLVVVHTRVAQASSDVGVNAGDGEEGIVGFATEVGVDGIVGFCVADTSVGLGGLAVGLAVGCDGGFVGLVIGGGVGLKLTDASTLLSQDDATTISTDSPRSITKANRGHLFIKRVTLLLFCLKGDIDGHELLRRTRQMERFACDEHRAIEATIHHPAKRPRAKVPLCDPPGFLACVFLDLVQPSAPSLDIVPVS